MLHTFIFWLQSHRWANLLLVLLYFVFIVFMHHPLVLLSMWVERSLTFGIYNTVVATVFTTLVVGMLYVVYRQAARHTANRATGLFYIGCSLLLLFAHSRFMFDSNIEVIHALEFTLLAFLIFPITRRFGAAVLFTLPFMLIDEWYQYILLYPDWNDYLDLNDILTDTYGCGLAMAVLMLCGVKGNQHVPPLYKRPEFIVLAAMVLLVIVATLTCIIAPYAGDACANTLLVVNERLTAEPFWRPHPTHGNLFHVMKPAEALIAITLLHLFYTGMDSFRK